MERIELKTQMKYAVDISTGDRVFMDGTLYRVAGFGQNGAKAQMFLEIGGVIRLHEFRNPHGTKFAVEVSR